MTKMASRATRSTGYIASYMVSIVMGCMVSIVMGYMMSNFVLYAQSTITVISGRYMVNI